MKASTAAARNTVKNQHAIYAKARLRAEWEHNRYQTPIVTVTPDQSGDDEWTAAYDYLETIGEPNRPAAGIAKARTGSNVVPTGVYRDVPKSSRFYPSDQSDVYNYWASIQKTGTSLV